MYLKRLGIMKKYVGLLVLLVAFVGCDDADKETNNAQSNLYITYELKAGACTTDLHSFRADSEHQLETELCDTLKDQAANNNCALYQREQVFRAVECPGSWPYSTPTTTQNHSRSYSYQDTRCTTGYHFFAATTERDVMRLYCRGLRDDGFNLNCAGQKRDEEYAANNCQNFI
jgi:hypothetical protein